MKFMLDTNACILAMKLQSSSMAEKMRRHLDELCVSTLTVAELRFGAERSANRSKNHLAVDAFVVPLRIECFDETAAYVYGIVRARLQRQGCPIGPIDTLIGAHALSLKLTLVTNNLPEFRRIEGLNVEDWSA